MKAFTAPETAAIQAALAVGGRLLCPACGTELDERRVAPSEIVSYVRRRTVVACPACGRHGAFDRARGGR